MNLGHRPLLFSLLLLLAAGGALGAGPRPAPSPQRKAPPEIRPLSARPLPVITVEAVYHGANASVVADTVAAPIEQQVNGVEKMRHMISRCTNEGDYRLDVIFEPGVDLNVAQVLIQNRVSLAEPVLPELVQRRGVTVKKAAELLLLLTLSSPDGSRDVRYLGRYATTRLRDEFARVPGVGGVTCLGQVDSGFRVWLDREKLAAHKLTISDVVQGLEAQSLQVEPGQFGRPPTGKRPEDPVHVSSPGAPDPEQVANMILKVNSEGGLVRLRDVARVELVAHSSGGHAFLNDKPVVVLGISSISSARPREVSAGLRDKVSDLRKGLPHGVDLDVVFDLPPDRRGPDRPEASDYLLLEPGLPGSISTERAERLLRSCAAVLKEIKGVQAVLTLPEDPFAAMPGSQPCILLHLAAGGKPADRQQLIQTIRTRIGEVKGVVPRVLDLSGSGGFPRYGYPIDLAVHGPEGDEVRKLGEKLADQLRQSRKLMDLGSGPSFMPEKQVYVDVDRNAAQRLGVSLSDVYSTLQVDLGSSSVNDFNRFGRTWQLRVEVEGPSRTALEDLKQLKVRSRDGKMVNLASFVAMREVVGVAVLDRLDGAPMVEITANPAPGVSLAEARTLCEQAVEEVRKELRLPAGYKLTWMRELPAR